MKRKHYTKYGPDDIGYGFIPPFGFGVYTYNEPKIYWQDKEVATEEELENYKQYLKDNGWEE